MLHGNIMQTMRKLNYKSSDTGLCYGISSAFVLSFLIKKGVEEFNIFLNAVSKMSEQDQTVTITEYTTPTLRLLYTFFDIIEFMQLPTKFPHIRSVYGNFSGQNLSFFSPLFLPEATREENDCIEKYTSFLGAYTENELYLYVKNLKESVLQLRKSTCPFFTIMLGSISHVISIGFSPKSQAWILMDANQLPIKYVELENIEQVTRFILRGLTYRENKNFILSTELLGLKSEQMFLNKLIKIWQNSPQYIDLHSPSVEKVSLQDGRLITWFEFLIVSYKNTPEKSSAMLIQELESLYQVYPEVINMKNSKNQSPIFTALHLSFFSVIDYLNQKDNLVLTLLERKNIEFAVFYKKHPELINHVNTDGYTPLIEAILNNNHQLVKLLLNISGINPNIPSEITNGLMPLQYAILYNHEETFKHLLEHPCIDVNASTQQVSVMQVALLLQSIRYIRALAADPRLNINAITPDGLSLLNYALLSCHDDIIRIFLDHPQIDIYSKNNQGMTSSEYVKSINREYLMMYLHPQRDLLSSAKKNSIEKKRHRDDDEPSLELGKRPRFS
jgi:ankyrin repeat protein